VVQTVVDNKFWLVFFSSIQLARWLTYFSLFQ
jgi:hypothetical protein